MSRRNLVLALVTCVLWSTETVVAHSQDAQAAGVLMVENRSGSVVDLHVWRFTGGYWDWSPVTTLNPGSGVPLSDVHHSERFRAWLRSAGQYRYHSVELSGGQDRWRIE
jgi:hypothetical protein